MAILYELTEMNTIIGIYGPMPLDEAYWLSGYMFRSKIRPLEEELKMAEEITLAKACMDVFSPSRKLTTQEYRELTQQDKEDLRDLFIKEGYNITPLKAPVETES